MTVSCIEKPTPSRASTMRRERQVSDVTSRSVPFRSSSWETIIEKYSSRKSLRSWNRGVLDVCGFAQYQGNCLTGDVADHFGQDAQSAFQHINLDGQSRHQLQNFVFWSGSFHQQTFFESFGSNFTGHVRILEGQAGQQSATFDGGAFDLDGDLGQRILDRINDLGEVTLLERVIGPVATQCCSSGHEGRVVATEAAVALTWCRSARFRRGKGRRRGQAITRD